MPDHVVLAQPDAEQHLTELPGASIVDAAEGWTAPEDTTVLFVDQPPANLADLARLEWVQLGSHGYAQLSGLRLPEATVVTNASGVQDRPIAEWVVLMLLALGRRFPDMLTAQREHRWDRSDAFQAELRGMPVGILGFGSIGREVARLLQPLGMPVHVMTRTRNRDRGARFDPLDRSPDDVPEPDRWFTVDQREEFYSGIRALVVAVPDSSGTRGLVDANAIAGMPRGALLLNPARARVVDEDALLAALRTGHLGGAALDDHYRQPMPPNDPFWDAPNTVVTAHISGSTGSPWYRQRIWALFLENVRRRAANEPMLNVIARPDLDLAGDAS
ncbi:MAG TPA: NAD(P)-dependent oxidoreductase [Lapillicoccus sp.]|nr:NAD(P)-dependent oxidoreductase [Lapillicoccus sp.]